MKRDASDIAFGGILSQIENDETVNPFVFRSWKFELVEINHDIDDHFPTVSVGTLQQLHY